MSQIARVRAERPAEHPERSCSRLNCKNLFPEALSIGGRVLVDGFRGQLGKGGRKLERIHFRRRITSLF
jgi:hypothetical protein